jgi:hypothetical protein
MSGREDSESDAPEEFTAEQVPKFIPFIFQFNVLFKNLFFSFFDVLLCLQGIQQDEEIRRVQKESKARYLRWSLYYSLNF